MGQFGLYYSIVGQAPSLRRPPRPPRGLAAIPNSPTTGIRFRAPRIDETRKFYQVAFEDVPAAEEDFLAIGHSARAAYAKARKQFGKPIDQFQAVQQSLRGYPAAYGKLAFGGLLRSLGLRGAPPRRGVGFAWEDNVHLYYKRAKASELMFGDATHHRERIARLTIDKPIDKL